MLRLLRIATPRTRILYKSRVHIRNATTASVQAHVPTASSSRTVPPLTQLHGVESQPIDWSFYRAILGEPILATYDALRTDTGYDAPWEVYLSRCDEHGRHFKTVLKRLHTERAQALKGLVKKNTRRNEQKYLMDSWDALVAKRRASEGQELQLDEKDIFPGGSFEEWSTWSKDWKEPHTVGYVLEKDVLDPSWGLNSLFPPNLNDPTSVSWRKVSRRENKEEAPIIRTIRTPPSGPDRASYPIASTVMQIDMKGHPVGVKVSYTVYFDKDKQELVAVDPKGKRICLPTPAKDLANAIPTIGYLLLARLQGLLDVDKLREKGIHVHTTETLDLATQLDRGTFFSSYNLGFRKRKGATSLLRVQIGLRPPPFGLIRLLSDDPLRPGDLIADFKAKIERDMSVAEQQLELERGVPRSGKRGRPKRLTPAALDPDQEFFLTPHPDHLPDGDLKDQRKKERAKVLPLPSHVTVPQLPTHGGKVRLVPYISVCGASPNLDGPQKWAIDTSTPNTSPDPATIQSAKTAPNGRLEGVIVKRSESPETLRFWSWDLGQDLVVRGGRAKGTDSHGIPLGYTVAYTGEEVRDRFPLMWKFAKERGHFQGINSIYDV